MDDLVTLRMLVAAAAGRDRDLLREAASLATLPVDMIEAETAGRAVGLLDGGDIDLVLLDSAWPVPERLRVAKPARTASKPVFVVALADESEPLDPAWADAGAARPSNVEEAKGLIDACVRSRLPSRVLVVDDSSTMRSIVRKILNASRFRVEVSEAEDGASAFAQVKNGAYDVVLLDYNMPGLDGVGTLTALKLAKPDVSVVIMTSAQDAELQSRAHAAGADGFLKKPFYPADIDAVLHRRCGLRAVGVPA